MPKENNYKIQTISNINFFRREREKRHFYTSERKNISQQHTHTSGNTKRYYSWRRKIIIDENLEIQNGIKSKNYKYMGKYK